MLNPFAVYNTIMKNEERKMIAYIVACINEFARDAGMTTGESFRYLYDNGGIDFLIEFYDTEHLLSFHEAVGDLKSVTQKTGGMIA